MPEVLRTDGQYDALVGAVNVELVDTQDFQIGQRQGLLAANRQRVHVQMYQTLEVVEHLQVEACRLGQHAAQAQVPELAEHGGEQFAPVDRGRQRIILEVRQLEPKVERLAGIVPSTFAGGEVIDYVQLFVGHFVRYDGSPFLVHQPLLNQVVQVEMAEDLDQGLVR